MSESLNETLLKRFREAINKVERFCTKSEFLKNYERDLIEVFTQALHLVDFSEEIPGHELEHTFRVLELALIIGCHEGANLLKLAISALLHDLGRFIKTSSKNHAELSADAALQVLKNTVFENLSKDVAIIIKEHSYSAKNKPSSLESAILQDADRIDALGVIGIARVFAYGGYLRRLLYRSLCSKNESSLDHFYSKILNLPKLIHTKIGKEIAERRARKVKEFLKEFKREIELKDIKDIL